MIITRAEKSGHGMVRMTVQVMRPKMDQSWWYGIGISKYNEMVNDGEKKELFLF